MPILWFSLQILVPVLFWAGYHYYYDRHLPEPAGNLLICFVLGFASAGISQLLYEGLGILGLRYDALELGLGNLPGLFAYAMLAIGPIEELAKLLPFLVVVLRFRALDEALDGIIYASFIALGYATAENLHYLQFLTSLEAVARGFAGPLVHIMFASVWGYYIARAYLARRAWLLPALWSVPSAAFLHGAYDFMVLAEPLAALPLSALLVLGIWIWRTVLIRGIHSRGGYEEKCDFCEVLAGAEPAASASARHPRAEPRRVD
ncbi:MAG TPA: PrsW family intramembrane metalloprotease [Woeseiaceae bacterium]|nr:PrsW family intramembrane metalloprotease [Woeseiaceae bacterium]